MMSFRLPDITVNMANIIVSPDTTVSPDITAHMVCMAANPQT